MTVQQRVAFLNNKTRTISAFFPKTSDSIKFEVNSKIVEDVIGDMFWHPEGDVEEDDSNQDAELITKINALKLFVKADDVDPDAPYKIEIKNVLCFDLATAHTSIGFSFRQTARIIAQHRAICKNPLLSGISDYTVGQFVRIQVGINLQLMASILARSACGHSPLLATVPHIAVRHFSTCVFALVSLASSTTFIWSSCCSLSDTPPTILPRRWSSCSRVCTIAGATSFLVSQRTASQR
jgi:hypothetical protein